jgi:hypothetical protein
VSTSPPPLLPSPVRAFEPPNWNSSSFPHERPSGCVILAGALLRVREPYLCQAPSCVKANAGTFAPSCEFVSSSPLCAPGIDPRLSLQEPKPSPFCPSFRLPVRRPSSRALLCFPQATKALDGMPKMQAVACP